MKPVDLTRTRAPNGIAYHRAGAGAPVVLIHGVGLRAECWRSQIKHLRADCEIFALDLPGHGQSDLLNQAAPALADYSDCIADFIGDTLKGPAVIAGHSLGAMIALDLAARYPGLCAGVAALNAIYRRGHQARKAVRERARLLRENKDRRESGQDFATSPITRWFGSNPGGDDGRSAALCRQWLMQGDPTGYAAAYSVFAEEDGPGDATLAAIGVPCLFLTGEEDLNSTSAMSSALAKQVHDATELTIEGAGHMVLMTHGREVNAALRTLMSRIPSNHEVL